MTPRIDLAEVLRGTVCDLYSNLLTRPTGAAVRGAIEGRLAAGRVAGATGPAIAVLDFTHVRLLDFSCADEIVGKLLLRTAGPDASLPSYLVFRGLHEDHLDPIETVLQRYALALVAIEGGRPVLYGTVDDDERAIWETVRALGRAAPAAVAARLPTDPRHAHQILGRLADRRLLLRHEEEFAILDIPLVA